MRRGFLVPSYFDQIIKEIGVKENPRDENPVFKQQYQGAPLPSSASPFEESVELEKKEHGTGRYVVLVVYSYTPGISLRRYPKLEDAQKRYFMWCGQSMVTPIVLWDSWTETVLHDRHGPIDVKHYMTVDALAKS